MFTFFERLVAWRYLRAKRSEGFISLITWFSLLGIALGVATLIIVMSVMNGFRGELLGRVMGLNGHMNIYAQEGPIPDYDAVAAKARAVPGITFAAPLIEAQALLTTDGTASGAMVRGLRPADFTSRKIINTHISGGDLQNFGPGQIVIGRRMAERLHIAIGQEVTLLSPRGAQTAFGIMPRSKNYQVAATFDVGMYEYDNGFIFMDLTDAQAFFRLPDKVTAIELMIENPVNVDQFTKPVQDAVGPDWRVQNWQQTNSSFFTALEVERNVMFIILSLIIMVAAFNIISGLIMLVKDKTADIAVLRTMGASQGSIMRIFFMSGAVIGVAGTILGLIIGVAFAMNIENIRQFIQHIVGRDLFSAEIYFLTQLPAKVDAGEVTQIVLMALGLSFVATLYPAWRAAKTDPVEALRYE